MSLEWRKEPPDRPGWWWRRHPDVEGEPPFIEHVWELEREHGGGLYVLDLRVEKFTSSEWAGPIEPPERRGG